MSSHKTSIVWNPSRKCVWNCAFCCLNAVTESNDNSIKDLPELTIEEKKLFIKQLSPEKFSLDFGGGEVLANPEHLDLILYASDHLGAKNIGISKTGAYLTDEIMLKLSGKINDIELSLDVAPSEPYPLRPAKYHELAAQGMIKLKSYGIYVGAQTVLTKHNIAKEKVAALFAWLEEHEIDKWSLLRLFPAGRGGQFDNITPSYEEYCQVVEYIQSISKNSKLNVHFQYLLPGHPNYTTKCRAVKRSVGLLHNGYITACFWDLDEEMMPKDAKYILGKVPDETLEAILSNEKSQYWLSSDNNCRIFER